MSDRYYRVIKYKITMKCDSILHVGAASGDKEDVLSHPVTAVPFVQASTLTGMMRDCVEEMSGVDIANEIFEAEQGSLLKVTDGEFIRKSMSYELRPHIMIDTKSGAVAEGHKYNMGYIGKGAEFTFECYLYLADDNKYADAFEAMLGLLKNEGAAIGSKKSSGAGRITLIKALKQEFDITKKRDRARWYNEDSIPDKDYMNITNKLAVLNRKAYAYRISLNGKTEGPMLIKALYSEGYGAESPDDVNINENGDYIIPGSSIKGVVKNQMSKIAGYLGKERLIDRAFGTGGESASEGRRGNLFFHDTVVGKGGDNARNPIRHRIHIDKFTGGVFNGALFSERNVSGNVSFDIEILRDDSSEVVLGLLVMALRDICIHTVNFGSGYANGKGFIDADKLTIESDNGTKVDISFKNNNIDDSAGIIAGALSALREV